MFIPIEEYEKYEEMKKQIAHLNDELNIVKQENLDLQEAISKLTLEKENLLRKIFGSKSEKTVKNNNVAKNEEPVFNEVEVVASRPKPKTKRKKKATFDEQFEGVETKEIVHEFTEEELKQYSDVEVIGKVFIRNEVVIKPAEVYIIKHYAQRIKHIEKGNDIDSPSFAQASTPPAVIPGSYPSATLVSYALIGKYADAMPLNRIAESLKHFGIPGIEKQGLSNWILKASELYLTPLYNKLVEHLLTNKVLHVDETTVQVHNEQGRKNTSKSYMWLYTTSKHAERQISIFQYTPRRSGENAKIFLENFKGEYLQVDGYKGYNKVKDVIVANCWAHARRAFVEICNAIKQPYVQKSQAYMGVTYINMIYQLEYEIEEKINNNPKLTTQEQKLDALLEYRKEYSVKLLESFYKWIDEIIDESTGNLKAALNYCITYKEGLSMFLRNSLIVLDNNKAERNIKRFAVGRKNWLFCKNPRGAEASSIIYSVMVTALENKVNLYEYINHILTELSTNEITDELLESILPWSDKLPNNCRKKD